MKKVIVIALSLVIAVMLGGCMNGGRQLTNELKSEQSKADDMMKKIISALDDQDVDALKNLFSPQTREDVVDLERQITELMDFYGGKTTNYKGHVFSSNDKESGKIVEQYIEGMYRLETENVSYRVDFGFKPICEKNSDEIGLGSLELVTEETYQKSVDEIGTYKWQAGDSGPGVYMKE